MGKEESSQELSSLAARVLKMPTADDDVGIANSDYNNLLKDAKRLAGSVLTQDETPLPDNFLDEEKPE